MPRHDSSLTLVRQLGLSLSSRQGGETDRDAPVSAKYLPHSHTVYDLAALLGMRAPRCNEDIGKIMRRAYRSGVYRGFGEYRFPDAEEDA